MKYLKKYNESNNSDYSIYEWFEDLKLMWVGRKPIDMSELKKWADHFIGENIYESVLKLVDNIFISLQKVDYNYINDRMLEVWDELPLDKEKYILGAVATYDYENKGYNNFLTISGTFDNSEKINVVVDIIKDIVYPTLFIGSPSIHIRRTNEQIYVTDKKWNCVNFSIDKYGFKVGDVLDNGNSMRRKTTTIFSSDIKRKSKYSVSKIIQLYEPSLVIKIGDYVNNSVSFKLNHIESMLEESLETILPELDYKKVIWDYSKGDRQFNVNTDIYDYSLKIILN